MGNHKSHISLRAINKARERGIVLLNIPPKTSHKLQPLIKTVFGSFKNGYNKAIDNWMRCKPGKTHTINNILALIHQTQRVAMVPQNLVSRFIQQAIGLSILTFLAKVILLQPMSRTEILSRIRMTALLKLKSLKLMMPATLETMTTASLFSF